VGRWDLRERRYEPGAWLAGRLFPRRSDLSPDGRYLCYFVHKPSARWRHGVSYVAVSRLPWLTALYAFPTLGTWTRGYCFTDTGGPESEGKKQLPIPYGLREVRAEQFASERRRGWRETAGCPKRDARDLWDQRRNARLEKVQPGGERLLCVEAIGWAGGELGVEQAIDGLRVSYWLEADGDVEVLSELQWADWDHDGNLLAATRSGRIQILEVGRGGWEVVFEEDLSRLEPAPVPAPGWAQAW
jgi:hypothetical protein